jgi:hypothetical protein
MGQKSGDFQLAVTFILQQPLLTIWFTLAQMTITFMH